MSKVLNTCPVLRGRSISRDSWHCHPPPPHLVAGDLGQKIVGVGEVGLYLSTAQRHLALLPPALGQGKSHYHHHPVTSEAGQ